ncbi:glycosyltransferase [Cloacibacillus porcorum]
MKKKLLLLSTNNPNTEPRLWRQLLFFKNKYDVTVAATQKPDCEDIAYLKIAPLNKYKRVALVFNMLFNTTIFCSKIYGITEKQTFDVIISHDIGVFPLAFCLAKESPVIFDAHEYYPRQKEHTIFGKLFISKLLYYICNKYMNRCTAIITVGENISNKYKTFVKKPIIIVRNSPSYFTCIPSQPDFNHIKLIHHGNASPNRNIEIMLKMMDYLDERFSLTLMLVGSGKYYNKLKKLAFTTPRVVWKEPVPMNDIIKTCSDYDIGVFLVPPSTYNLLQCLPNKFFEFIQARLAVAIGPSPEMAAIVKKYEIGCVSKEFTPQSLAAELNKISLDKIITYKKNTLTAAKDFCAENELRKLSDLISEIIRG